MKWKLKNEDLRRINRTNRRPIITPHLAHSPKHLNIRVLPIPLKKKICEQLEEFVAWTRGQKFTDAVIKQAEEIAEGLVTYMLAEDYHAKHWQKFCSYTTKLDKIRHQDFFSLVPEVKDFFIVDESMECIKV
jgi:hypothetical protein